MPSAIMGLASSAVPVDALAVSCVPGPLIWDGLGGGVCTCAPGTAYPPHMGPAPGSFRTPP
jgi:hypothetical protein